MNQSHRGIHCKCWSSRSKSCCDCAASALQVLFKTVRVDKARFADLKPVMIHVNYHVRSSLPPWIPCLKHTCCLCSCTKTGQSILALMLEDAI
jgi:hypothetical protein